MRGLIWGLGGLIWSLRAGFERPSFGSEWPDLGSEGPNLGSQQTNGQIETGGICCVWNQRSSAPPGPLLKRNLHYNS